MTYYAMLCNAMLSCTSVLCHGNVRHAIIGHQPTISCFSHTQARCSPLFVEGFNPLNGSHSTLG